MSEETPHRSVLVAISPALVQRPDDWAQIIAALKIEPELEGGDWHVWPDAPNGWRFSSGKRWATRLRRWIDSLWSDGGGYQSVVLVGHSLGALLMREAYLQAVEQHQNKDDSWASRVSRIVLFAGLSKGWRPKYRGPIKVLARTLQLAGLAKALLVRDLIEGSAFVTNLRLRWIRHFRDQTHEKPTVVQVFGTDDEIVDPDETIDLAQFPNALRVVIAGGRHADLYRLQEATNQAHRYAQIRDAFCKTPVVDAANEVETESGPVVFVLHGMRASNEGWPEQVAAQIKMRAKSAQIVRPKYERVSVWDFCLPYLRRKPIAWFYEEYAYQLANYPTATFHFVGHSNATYILGQSLVLQR